MTSDKVRENRLRRYAKRCGLALKRDRTRDPRALDFGRYYLYNPDRNSGVYGYNHRAGLDDIEAYLDETFPPKIERMF